MAGEKLREIFAQKKDDSTIDASQFPLPSAEVRTACYPHIIKKFVDWHSQLIRDLLTDTHSSLGKFLTDTHSSLRKFLTDTRSSIKKVVD